MGERYGKISLVGVCVLLRASTFDRLEKDSIIACDLPLFTYYAHCFASGQGEVQLCYKYNFDGLTRLAELSAKR